MTNLTARVKKRRQVKLTHTFSAVLSSTKDQSMKVLLITGSYPPDKCGVGDYTFHLANALASCQNLQVGVLTNAAKFNKFDDGLVTVFRKVSGWRNENLLEIRNVILSFNPDIVHIQYPTQGYRGSPPKLLPIFLRMMHVPVVQTWHEYYYASGVSWPNLLACDALIYARPDFPQRIPRWVARYLSNTPIVYIPNTTTIPVVSLSAEQSRIIKHNLSGGKPIVCFFGFAHANKGLERLFEIANPEQHHLVLICDLSSQDPYQANILHLANQAPWSQNVTITGFQSPQRVGEILAVADAVVFPFPNGAGEWNTSLKASEAAGAFTLATSQDMTLLGYHEDNNIFYAGCGKIMDMRNALDKYLGKRRPSETRNEWMNVAVAHEQIYKNILILHR
jgi:glycosyltransferase involved in cell wall biosynthesis